MLTNTKFVERRIPREAIYLFRSFAISANWRLRKPSWAAEGLEVFYVW